MIPPAGSAQLDVTPAARALRPHTTKGFAGPSDVKVPSNIYRPFPTAVDNSQHGLLGTADGPNVASPFDPALFTQLQSYSKGQAAPGPAFDGALLDVGSHPIQDFDEQNDPLHGLTVSNPSFGYLFEENPGPENGEDDGDDFNFNPFAI